MTGEERDDDLVLNTHRNLPGGFGKIGVPANYLQMKTAMSRIVREMKEAGIASPTNAQVMSEYARRMRESRRS